MAFLGSIHLGNSGTRLELFTALGLTPSGRYRIRVKDYSGIYLGTSSTVTNTDGYPLGSTPVEFDWDDTPLYIYNAGQGPNVYLPVVVVPAAPVTADVSLSVGSCS